MQPDLSRPINEIKFSVDYSHNHEPGCTIKEAVEVG